MKQIFLTLLVASLIAASAYGDSLTLDLFPSGTVSGAAGTVVGWGYNIANNDPSNWAVLNDSFVTGALSTGTFGTYQDYIGSNFIVIGPSSNTGNVAFSQGSTGTGEFDIDMFVPPMTITGDINIDYTLFAQDPNDPNFDPASFIVSGTISADAQVDVPSSVPEPASVGLTLAALLCGGIVLCRRRAVETATR